MLYTPLLAGWESALVYAASYAEIGAAEAAPELLLGAEELERAGRFAFEEDQRRYLLAHAFMRRVLGIHTRLHPAAVPLQTVENEPPTLVQRPHFPPLHLSLSHCRTHVAVAVSASPGIGVDVEHVSAARDGAEIVAAFFAPEEQSALLAHAPADFDEAFLRIWTSKEAMSKALGVGLAMPLDQIVVGTAPGPPTIRLGRAVFPAASFVLGDQRETMAILSLAHAGHSAVTSSSAPMYANPARLAGLRSIP